MESPHTPQLHLSGIESQGRTGRGAEEDRPQLHLSGIERCSETSFTNSRVSPQLHLSGIESLNTGSGNSGFGADLNCTSVV